MSTNSIKYRDRYIRRAARILPVIQPGKPFTPEAIDKIVGGAYSSKFVYYLRELGFEFSQQKDGRKIVSYTLIKEPDDAATIRASAPTKTRAAKGSAKPKVAKVKTSKSIITQPTFVPKVAASADKALAAENAAIVRAVTKAENAADIKAKNLETMKKVSEKFAAAKKSKVKKAKKVREFDDVTEQFGSSGEVGTSFSVERDWDSIEGLDLQKLVG